MHLLFWGRSACWADANNTDWIHTGVDMDLEVQGLLKCRGIGQVLSADPAGLANEERRMEETNGCVVWLKTKE